MKRTTIIDLIAALLMILFLYTGISKLAEYLVFKEQIAESPLLAKFASFIAVLLPITEFGATILLIVPRWRLKGFFASLTLMILFTLYIVAILSFNEHIPCSCGGVIALLSWKQHIIFNGLFIVLSGIGIILERDIKSRIEMRKVQKIEPGI